MKLISNLMVFIVTLFLTMWLFTGTAFASAADKNDRFVITIIDTGIDLKNETLRKQLCVRSEAPGNGKDDDGNGFVDDVHGWSFFDDSNDIQDHHGHGTHIAGIIYEELKTMKLESRFCFQVLKYYDSDEPASNLLTASNDAFKYALNNGSQLVNYSGGGYAANNTELKWIRELGKKNVAVVAAMGNQKVNTDLIPFYPASYSLENIFAIGAAEGSQNMAAFSNYGKKRFDFLAPGVLVESMGLNNSRAYISGTSQATAKVCAIIAYLIFQESGPAKWAELKGMVRGFRAVYVAKKSKGNPLFVEAGFIQKYKTSSVDAFGEP